MRMKIEFDPAKNRSNLAKHGTSLAEARQLDWEAVFAWQDHRRDYGEIRMVGLVPMGTRLYCVVFTDRGGTRRIISLRKANKREVRYYAAEN